MCILCMSRIRATRVAGDARLKATRSRLHTVVDTDGGESGRPEGRKRKKETFSRGERKKIKNLFRHGGQWTTQTRTRGGVHVPPGSQRAPPAQN